MTLFEFTKDVYRHLGQYIMSLSPKAEKIISEYSFDKIISDDKICYKLIQEAFEFKSVDEHVTKANIHRASHILVTWLMGLGLANLFQISAFPLTLPDIYDDYIWLQTAILHDYGYFRKELKDENLTLADITKPYNLLTDEYPNKPWLSCLDKMSDKRSVYNHFFTYSYQEIEAYFNYSKEFHSYPQNNRNGERNDHGIVGGCLAFREYCRGIEIIGNWIDDDMTIVQKIACVTVASHNIFKSSNPEMDKHYKKYGLKRLISTCKKQPITMDNPLLCLLSVVDTVECTKRFSAHNNPQKYLRQNTILKHVGIDIDKKTGGIKFDYSGLYDYILKNKKGIEMINELSSHVRGISELNKWTPFMGSIDKKNPYCVWVVLDR